MHRKLEFADAFISPDLDPHVCCGPRPTQPTSSCDVRLQRALPVVRIGLRRVLDFDWLTGETCGASSKIDWVDWGLRRGLGKFWGFLTGLTGLTGGWLSENFDWLTVSRGVPEIDCQSTVD